MDRDQLLRALTATGWNVARTAAQFGLHANTLTYHLRRLGIERPSKPAAPVERHPPTVQLVSEMEALRIQARLLIRRPGTRAIQELLRIEARHRYLRSLLRAAMGEAEATDTRLRSPAAFGAAGGPHASWQGQRP